MRSLALALAAILPLTAAAQSPAPQPAPAQEWSPPLADAPETPAPESGLDLIERGAGIIFENLLREVQPEMEGMARGLDQTLDRFAPVFNDLATLMDDIGNYQTPERLPNGDILIRRRPDAPPPPPVGNALRDLTRPTPDAPGTPEPAPDATPRPLPSDPPIEL